MPPLLVSLTTTMALPTSSALHVCGVDFSPTAISVVSPSLNGKLKILSLTIQHTTIILTHLTIFPKKRYSLAASKAGVSAHANGHTPGCGMAARRQPANTKQKQRKRITAHTAAITNGITNIRTSTTISTSPRTNTATSSTTVCMSIAPPSAPVEFCVCDGHDPVAHAGDGGRGRGSIAESASVFLCVCMR